MQSIIFETPIGKMFISEKNNKIMEIGILKSKNPQHQTNENSILLKNAKKQLLEYFKKERKQFNLPLHFEGTHFQKKVWQELCKIPHATTTTYKNLAKKIGNSNAVRAVGNANNKNKFLIVVPCHRVIGSDGKLVGYAEGLEIKKFLLNLEN